MLRSIDHSSTLTMVQTAIRAPPGSLSAGRSTMAEYGTRSFGCTAFTILSDQERGDHMLKSLGLLLAALTTTAGAQTVGFATLPPGSILHAQASVIAKVVQD